MMFCTVKNHHTHINSLWKHSAMNLEYFEKNNHQADHCFYCQQLYISPAK